MSEELPDLTISGVNESLSASVFLSTYTAFLLRKQRSLYAYHNIFLGWSLKRISKSALTKKQCYSVVQSKILMTRRRGCAWAVLFSSFHLPPGTPTEWILPVNCYWKYPTPSVSSGNRKMWSPKQSIRSMKRKYTSFLTPSPFPARKPIRNMNPSERVLSLLLIFKTLVQC